MSDPTTFMLDSLRELQTTLLLLMERANWLIVPEATVLESALTKVLTAYRDLRSGRIDWREAARAYQIASNMQLECDRAALDVEMAGNHDWWVAKRVAEREASS